MSCKLVFNKRHCRKSVLNKGKSVIVILCSCCVHFFSRAVLKTESGLKMGRFAQTQVSKYPNAKIYHAGLE